MNVQNLQENPFIQFVFQAAENTGANVYLVGGAVRDALILKSDENDFDFSVQAGLSNFVSELSRLARGTVIPWDKNQIRVVCRKGPHRATVDVSLMQGKTIQDDLLKRDFTINAMAIEIAGLVRSRQPYVIDPLKGRDDVTAGIVRAASGECFKADPLRVLRGIRFACECRFRIDPETFSSMRRDVQLLRYVARERILREMFSILHLPGVMQSVRQIVEMEAAAVVLPELLMLQNVSQGPPHQHSLFEHSLLTAAEVQQLIDSPEVLSDAHADDIVSYFNQEVEEAVTRRSLLVFAALLHDSGKIPTLRGGLQKGQFHGHAKAGGRLNRRIAERLGLGKRARKILQTVTENHMRVLNLALLEQPGERALKRFLKDLEGTELEVVFLAVADTRATSGEPTYREQRRRVRDVARALLHLHYMAVDEKPTGFFLTGQDIMRILNIPQGPEVGRCLKAVQDQERFGAIISREDAVRWLMQNKKLFLK